MILFLGLIDQKAIDGAQGTSQRHPYQVVDSQQGGQQVYPAQYPNISPTGSLQPTDAGKIQ